MNRLYIFLKKILGMIKRFFFSPLFFFIVINFLLYGAYLKDWGEFRFALLNLYIWLFVIFSICILLSSFFYSSLRRSIYNSHLLLVYIYILALVCVHVRGFGTSVDYLIVANPVSYLGLFLKKNFFMFEFGFFSICFSGTTLSISYVVTLYAESYMADNLNRKKFITLVRFFTIAMVGFFHSVSFFSLFFFWELIGLISFLLIGYFSNKYWALKSALKAFIFNKFSDVFLLIAMVYYYSILGTLFISEENIYLLIQSKESWSIFGIITVPISIIVLVCILLATSIKSALLFYHIWLPDSMEAPVPASALIHSSTLVSAGVYLILKFKLLVLAHPRILMLIYIWTLLTTLVCSITALYQGDVKRLLAFSTISNCAILFMYVLVTDRAHILHYFITHGYSKALLFLIVGFFFILNNHQQDLNKQYLPFYYSNIILALVPSLLFLSFFPITTPVILKEDLLARLSIYGYGFSEVYFWVIKSCSTLYTLKLVSLIHKNGALGPNKKNKSQIIRKVSPARLLWIILFGTLLMIGAVALTSPFWIDGLYNLSHVHKEFYSFILKNLILLCVIFSNLYFKGPDYSRWKGVYVLFFGLFFFF